jgi:hypothetical protein
VGTIQNGTAGAAGAAGSGTSPKTISNSLRIRGASGTSGGYLTRTPASVGNRRTWTFSTWIKRGDLYTRSLQRFFVGTGTDDFIRFNGDAIEVMFDSGASGGASYQSYTSSLYRDPNAWYHIILAVDTTQATAADRVKLYVNGIQQVFTTANYPAQNYQSSIGNNTQTNVGSTGVNTGEQFDGYIAETHYVNGQQLTPTSFGFFDYNGAWRAKTVSGMTYGTTGFYLSFSDTTSTTTLGYDSSGNSNNWTLTNFSLTPYVTYDAMTDSPYPNSSTVGNYATLNPLEKTSTATLSYGNMRIDATGTTAVAKATFGGSGTMKFYVEFTIGNSGASASIPHCLITDASTPVNLSAGPFSYYRSDGQIDGSAYASYTTNDIIGCAVDCSTGNISWYKNNTLQVTRTGYSSTISTFIPALMVGSASGWGAMNCGQHPYVYTPPSGYGRLQTYNLPNSAVVRPRNYFDCILWTGTATASGRSFTGLGFSPDLIWSSFRTSAGAGNASKPLYDSVRGTAKALFSDQTTGDALSVVYGYVSSFDSNGFTTTAGTTNNGEYNQLGRDFVGWCWKKGAVPGFDIVSYTGTGSGRTIAHSLSATPGLIFVKNRSTTSQWIVWHKSFDVNNYLQLNATTGATNGSTSMWNSAAHTSSTFSIGTDGAVNTNGNSYVAYLWSEVAGFSKFGQYTGNGSADGPFVYCGFKPRYLMFKRTDTTSDWYIYDSVRNVTNYVNLEAYPHLNAAEVNGGETVDFLSNGFKIRTNQTPKNASGGTFVYAAFADQPFKYATAQGAAQEPAPAAVVIPGYRYVKWTITDVRSTGSGVQASEFCLQNGGADISGMTSASVTGFGGAGGSQGPGNLVDNNVATKTYTGTNPTIETVFDLGVNKVFNGYRWSTADDVTQRDPISWTISGSTDGVTYTTLHTVTGASITTSRNTNAGNWTY